jgi:phytoene synthase
MDDLVDEPGHDGVAAAELLELWLRLARGAYDGAPSGLDVIDDTMCEMAAHDVPFGYVVALADGMRMDLRRARYDTLTELRAYAHCVAGVVGLWIARLSGVRDGRALQHAARMGEAMQLSNIVRDVGDDHARGRLYLPGELLARHGLEPADVGAIVAGVRPVDGAYRATLDEIMDAADADYEAAFAWLPALPVELRPCMAVAARVYRGIHDAVRASGYDPRLRARTTAPQKLTLAARALLELRALARRPDGAAPHGALPEASHG